MNWNAIASAAEAIASVTVVISLIYLAIQVKLQAKEHRMMVTNSLTQQWGEALQAIAGNEDLHRIWMCGLVDIEGLTAAERGRFSATLMNLTQIFESLHLHYRDGKVDPAIWEAFDQRLRDVFALPGVQAWWALRRHWHTRGFRSYVDQVIANCAGSEGRYVAIYAASGADGKERDSRPIAA